jgi:hypothetical protein
VLFSRSYQELFIVNRRRFLTGKEVQAMMQAARHGQTGERDYCLILLAFVMVCALLDLTIATLISMKAASISVG